jgi:hypothetical protein
MAGPPRQLTTVGAVDDAIGRARLCEITRRESNVVTNWRARRQIAPFCFLIVTAELARLGYWAKPELWGIVSPKNGKRRK